MTLRQQITAACEEVIAKGLKPDVLIVHPDRLGELLEEFGSGCAPCGPTATGIAGLLRVEVGGKWRSLFIRTEPACGDAMLVEGR